MLFRSKKKIKLNHYFSEQSLLFISGGLQTTNSQEGYLTSQEIGQSLLPCKKIYNMFYIYFLQLHLRQQWFELPFPRKTSILGRRIVTSKTNCLFVLLYMLNLHSLYHLVMNVTAEDLKVMLLKVQYHQSSPTSLL